MHLLGFPWKNKLFWACDFTAFPTWMWLKSLFKTEWCFTLSCSMLFNHCHKRTTVLLSAKQLWCFRMITHVVCAFGFVAVLFWPIGDVSHPGSHCCDFYPGALSWNQVLQLIWRSGTRRWNLRVPDLQLSCSDLTTWQGTRIIAPVMTAAKKCPILSYSSGLLHWPQSKSAWDAALKSLRKHIT